jgi:hypothetical protein
MLQNKCKKNFLKKDKVFNLSFIFIIYFKRLIIYYKIL